MPKSSSRSGMVGRTLCTSGCTKFAVAGLIDFEHGAARPKPAADLNYTREVPNLPVLRWLTGERSQKLGVRSQKSEVRINPTCAGLAPDRSEFSIPDSDFCLLTPISRRDIKGEALAQCWCPWCVSPSTGMAHPFSEMAQLTCSNCTVV